MQRKLQLEADICNKLDQLNITMFGRRIHNLHPLQGKRTSYDIHPYTKQGTGVSCTLTYTDAYTKIPYVLLAKKPNNNQYDQIGGYTNGQGPEGSEINYDARSEDERDNDEERMIGNNNFTQIETKKFATSTQTLYSLKQLKDAATQGFIEQQSAKLGKKINPLQMKETLRQHGILYKKDYNAWDTALREIKEETGLDLSAYKPKELYTSDDFGISNEDERLHTKATHYLFHLGTLCKPPLVKPGNELELLLWVPVTAIELYNLKVINGLPIRKSYLLQTLPRALKKLREMELAEATNNRFSHYKNLGAHTFSNPFSLAACEYHQEILTKAVRISGLLEKEIERGQSINKIHENTL